MPDNNRKFRWQDNKVILKQKIKDIEDCGRIISCLGELTYNRHDFKAFVLYCASCVNWEKVNEIKKDF
jgi:hypothetical protein